MDIRTGRTYATKDDALSAGVPESDIAEIERTREGPNPKFTNPKHPVRHQNKRELARRRARLTKVTR